MSGNMHDLSGWTATTCLVADLIRGAGDVTPVSSLTDMDGTYGTPIVYTEWGMRSSGTPVLREYRWPASDRTCEHYVPEEDR